MSKVNNCKFKVGDYVIGNKKANGNYSVTKRAWVGKVSEVYDDYFTAYGFDPMLRMDLHFGHLKYECFDLYTKDQPTKIVITTDGKTTTAKMYRDKQLVEVQTTKCHPEDRFDFKVGARIAFDRLVGEKKEEPAKPKYYNGKVVCVNNGGIPELYTEGKIYQFVDGVFTFDDGDISGRMKSFKDWERTSSAKWLEVVE